MHVGPPVSDLPARTAMTRLEEEAASGPGSLVRELGALDATMIVVGSMIGSGIFITSAESARTIGSPGWLLVAWALAGLLTITGALCCAELSAMMPRAGGQYVFLREAYGPLAGFLFGWSTFLVVGTGTIAAVAVAFAKFLGVLVPWVDEAHYLVRPVHLGLSGFALSLSTQQLVAVLVIGGLTLANMQGLRTGKAIQNVLTIAKTGALVALIVLGVAVGLNRESAAFTSSWWSPAANGWSAAQAAPGMGMEGLGGLLFAMLLGKAMIGPLFSQTAWNSVTFTGAEVRDPGRTLPRALVLGCASVVVLYLLANLVYVGTLSLDAIRNAPQDRVGTAAVEAMLTPHGLGGLGLVAMSVAILISTFGCDNGLILSGARVYYAMARDGLFFRAVGRTNRHHVPAVALVAQGVWAMFLTLPRTVTTDAAGAVAYGNVYSKLLEYVVSADLLFYTVMVAAVLVLRRRRPGLDRPYRTVGYPLTPLVYITLAALLLADLVLLAPESSGLGFLIVLTGIPVYFLWHGRRPTADA
jgi:APA family basic amino acid/polyamine antiporter